MVDKYRPVHDISAGSRRTGRRLSFLLRHADSDRFSLNGEGWGLCSDVRKELNITQETILEIIKLDEKGRYELSECGQYIRAVQGHTSEQVDMSFDIKNPPNILYHGTPSRNISSIFEHGLNRGERHYVHLSADTETAATVGLRRSEEAAILRIDTRVMREAGCTFYRAKNGVWLFDGVIDPNYIAVHEYCSK